MTNENYMKNGNYANDIEFNALGLGESYTLTGINVFSRMK